jgi:hypothetical protein
VFTAPEGGVLRNTNFPPRFFDPAVEKAGLPGLTPQKPPSIYGRDQTEKTSPRIRIGDADDDDDCLRPPL